MPFFPLITLIFVVLPSRELRVHTCSIGTSGYPNGQDFRRCPLWNAVILQWKSPCLAMYTFANPSDTPISSPISRDYRPGTRIHSMNPGLFYNMHSIPEVHPEPLSM